MSSGNGVDSGRYRGIMHSNILPGRACCDNICDRCPGKYFDALARGKFGARMPSGVRHFSGMRLTGKNMGIPRMIELTAPP